MLRNAAASALPSFSNRDLVGLFKRISILVTYSRARPTEKGAANTYVQRSIYA